MKTPQNTKNRILIVKKILVLFSIALITFIHSSDVDIDLESFFFLFESKDIMNILLTSLFSVRPVSYGTSFFPHAWHLGHCPSGKKFGPYLKVRPSNPVSESYIWWEISAHESLWNASKPCFPKINAMKEYDFGSLSILTEWLRQVEALMVLAKTMTNIAILCNKRKWRFVQVFPFSWRSQKKGENSKVERVI